MQTVYSVQELADRWGLTPQSIRNMELEGKLHRLPDIPGERYAAREVYQLENIGGDAQQLSSYERKRLEDRIRQLEKLIHDYQDKLIELMRIAGNAKTG